MVWGFRFSAVALVSVAAGAACGRRAPADAPAVRAPSTGDVFGGKDCNSVRNPLEPALTAWKPDDRAQITALRQQGAIAVRYAVRGCNVELEVLPNCTGEGKYAFTPSPFKNQDVIERQSDLFAELPLGAARLAGEVANSRALRTDYVRVGIAALPSGKSYAATELRGPDCPRATHVIARIYLGGFAMAAGESKRLKAEASLLGLGGGARTGSTVKTLFVDGVPEACDQAYTSGEESPRCSVPLRVGLLPLEGTALPECPTGSAWDGARCVRSHVVTQVHCPTGTQWNGKACTATVSIDCSLGFHFVAGKGCVPDVAPAPAPAPAAAPAAPASALRGARMVSIPAGTFTMGSSDSDPDADKDEKPAHSVSVAAFEMDVTEVTVADYRACVNAGTCSADEVTKVWFSGITESNVTNFSRFCNYERKGRDKHPMNCVSWDEARAFCGWAGKRLPTEHEWEYAARGTDGRKFPWGNQAPGPALLNACGSECVAMVKKLLGATWASMYSGDDGFGDTAPVGSFHAGKSPFGLHDMAGNVWEWTSGGYCSYPLGASCPDGSRVARGGGWIHGGASWVRAAFRNGSAPSHRLVSIGFRCAR